MRLYSLCSRGEECRLKRAGTDESNIRVAE